MAVQTRTNRSTKQKSVLESRATNTTNYEIYPATRKQPGPVKQFFQALVIWIWVGGLFTAIAILPLICIYLSWSFIAVRLFVLAYACFIIYDANSAYTGRKSPTVQRYLLYTPLWDYFRGYFSARLVKTSELDPSKKYILGFKLF